MGTNYYATVEDAELAIAADLLEERGMQRASEIMRKASLTERHIGKSSAGWCFSLHVYPEDGINDLKDWLSILETATIKDEYGQIISFGEMKKRIIERRWNRDGQEAFSAAFLDSNHANLGPNGLLRHRIDGRHCISQGEGTWDCLIGEFS